MDLFWKTTAALFLTAVLMLTVGRQEKDLSFLLTMGACVMAVTAGLSFLEPVLEFLRQLQELGNLQSGMVNALLKAAGIGLVSEIGGMVLSDSGNTSLAKGLHLMGTSVILYLSVPVFESLLDLVQHILGVL